MANLVETPTYDAGVYQLELLDPVQGGPTGISNNPLKNLANRTAWLKQQVDGLLDGSIIPPTVAALSSPAFSGSPTAPTPPLGDNSTRIATTAFVQGTINGMLTKAVGGGSNVTLTAVEAGNGILLFTGVITANIAVIVPNSTKAWIVSNQTTGAFTLTVKTAAGTGVAVTQGRRLQVYSDGTNVVAARTDFASVDLTGIPTSPTAAPGTSTTQIATTAFVAAALAVLNATAVLKDSNTGAAQLPAGTTAQRPSPDEGRMRFNKTTSRYEGGNGSIWSSLGGATGGGTDAVFYLNDQVVTTSYAIPAGQNAMSAGPITIADGAEVTVPDGSEWTVV